MMCTLQEAGHTADLVTYGPTFDSKHLRSGPTFYKIKKDIRLWRALTDVECESYDLIFAHHVEAALICALHRVPHWIFVAHTALEPELPTYFRPSLHSTTAYLGKTLDRTLLKLAPCAAAVSPSLASTLSVLSGRTVSYLPIPWAVQAVITEWERDEARHSLGFLSEHKVVLYAGNLDTYQDWQSLMDAFGVLVQKTPEARLLFATASNTDALLRYAKSKKIASLLVTHALVSDSDRRVVHAAADVCVVSRKCAGGVPIKLLDALARGVPTLAFPHAKGGLSLDSAVFSTTPNPAQVAFDLERLLQNTSEQTRLKLAGPTYIQAHHNTASFLQTCTRFHR